MAVSPHRSEHRARPRRLTPCGRPHAHGEGTTFAGVGQDCHAFAPRFRLCSRRACIADSLLVCIRAAIDVLRISHATKVSVAQGTSGVSLRVYYRAAPLSRPEKSRSNACCNWYLLQRIRSTSRQCEPDFRSILGLGCAGPGRTAKLWVTRSFLARAPARSRVRPMR